MQLRYVAWLLLLLVDLRAPLGSEQTPKPPTIQLNSTETDSQTSVNKENLTALFDQYDLINWHSDSSASLLEELKSKMGVSTVQKCIEHANSTLKSNLTTVLNELEYSMSFQNCILREKWMKELPIDLSVQRRGFEEIFEKAISFDREIKSEYGVSDDCFYDAKYLVVKVPTTATCYWTDRSNWGAKVKSLQNFWATFGPDLLYLYDVVLYDPMVPDANVNRLWYLIAFIKVIAMDITNPYDLIALINDNILNSAKIFYFEWQLKLAMDELAALEATVGYLKIGHALVGK